MEKPRLTLYHPQEAEQERVTEVRRQMTRIRDRYDKILARLFRDKAGPEEIRQALATRDRLLEAQEHLIEG